MTRILYDITALRPLLEQGECVLTPNQRLRNRIREAFAAGQGRVGLTPAVYSLHEWLDTHWQRLQDLGVEGCQYGVINDAQARVVWKTVIDGSASEDSLFASSRLVQQAGEALRNLTLWQLPLSRIGTYGDRDEYPLQAWADAFQARLQALNLITREAAYEKVLHAFQTGALPRLPVIHLESLPDLPPLPRALVTAAAERVSATPRAGERDNRVMRLALPSAEEEIRAAARWAHQRLREDADSTIGIIVPDLGRGRDLVERLFTETFEPHYYSPSEARYTLPFNISTGTPLGGTPLVSATLQLLQLNDRQVEAGSLVNMFNSPFWGDFAAETAIRSAALEALNRRGQFHHSPAQIRSCLQRIAEQPAAGEAGQRLSRCLHQAASQWRRHSPSASPGQWVERILGQLDQLNWPGSRPLDSVEYQQVRQWYQLLERFASLDLVQGPMSFADAMALLRQLAHGTPFQAEVKQSPIQVLGTLEGEGLRFDHCWVLGMTNRAWPPSPEPNPLLPLALQRQHRMPRSSVEREVLFAEVLIRHYRHCAGTVVFSYAEQQDDARMLPSALIEDIPPTGPEALAGEHTESGASGLPGHYRQLLDRQMLEIVDCRYGPAVRASAGEPVRGGTGLLQQQAQCPFNAFATLRLGARQPVEPSLGLTPADKGSIVHNVLAALWRELGDQQGLKHNAATLNGLIRRTTEAVFGDVIEGYRSPLGERYLRLEQDRIRHLLEQFFQFEQQRPPFTVVATEEELLAEFAGFTFRLRIDRVDRTETGEHLIIDYKTGSSTSVNQWLGQRPDQPQLPLYALSYPRPVAGIGFAGVRAQDPGYRGIVDESVTPWDKRIKTPAQLNRTEPFDSWDSLLNSFKVNLETLVDEYRRGYAAVAVKDMTGATRHHAYLLPLNRLREADFLAFYLDEQSRS